MQFNLNRTVISILFTICFIFLSISAIIIYITRPNGYEVSIYSAVPLIAWFFLSLPLFFGIIISLRKALTHKRFRNLIADYQFLIGLLLIFISGIIVSSIPLIRGYYQWGRGDPFSHLLWMQDIELTGHIPKYLIYPLSHTYMVIVGLITNLNTSALMGNYSLLLGIPAILFSFLFAKKFIGEICAVIFLIFSISGSIGCLYFFAGTIPGYLFLLIIFLFMVLIQRADKSRTSFFILLIILIIAIVPGHPNAVINCAIVMVVIIIFFKYEEYSKKIQNHASFVPLFILFIAFFTWISQFWLLTSTLRKMRDVIYFQQENSEIAMLQQSLDYASSYGYSWVEMFFKVYGRSAIIIFVSMFALYIYYKENQKIKNRIAVIFILLFAFILCTGLLYLTNTGFGPQRMLLIAITFSSLLMALVLYYIRDWKYHFKNNYLSAQLFTIPLVIGLCVMSITTMYPSPYLLTFNDQYTLNEKMGIDWLKANSREADIKFIGLGEVMKRSGFEVKYPPYHFGYNRFPYLGNAINYETYYISDKLDRLLYTDVLQKAAVSRWLPEDFDKLEYDKSVDKYYSNGETEVRFIKKL